MNKEQIIKDLTLCIDCFYSLENVAIANILSRVRKELVNDWAESDMYYQQIQETITEEEKNRL